MKPGVGRQLAADHADLRERLGRIETLARSVLDAEHPLVGTLRFEGESLLKRLLEHIEWENSNLSPALRRSGPDGEEAASRMQRDHREQREMLEHVLRGLQDQSRPAVVLGRNLVDLVAMLREDMEDEEAALRAEGLLRG